MVARARDTQTSRRHLRCAAREAGWAAQVLAADYHAPSDAPLLTEDAAIMLVDQTLAAHGSHTACTRDEIRDAFRYLTSPRVQEATWTNDDRVAIVIRSQA